ncbi:hypothetical protein ACFW7J_10090 [Streptomyces sp. NPDC059525]|uniref:hypothetical protein n=1 Tax=Streptomyces sp. NPDC059525 TaxID=3346857 RepID=UPI00368DEADD
MAQAQPLDTHTPDSAPSPTGRAARRKENLRRARRGSLAARYLGYVGYFVGAGLISGAVVHHPLDPARYTRIALYGAAVFLAATVLNEFLLTRERPGLPRALVVIGSSLALSFGIGMLSGGLQHFDDFPARGAVLVPAGLVVSFIAYVIKDADIANRRVFGVVGLAVLITAALAFLGLREVAASMEKEFGAGHSHGSAEESGHEDGHAPAVQPATPAATSVPSVPPSPGQPSPKAPSSGDGHAHSH